MAKYTDGSAIRVAANMGSTQLNSGFAKRYFSLKTHPVFPLLMFWPDKHQITPVWSVSEYLALRKK
jgi:ferric iron reductase protein FhuF